MHIEQTMMKLMFFLIKDNELLEKNNYIWEKVKNSIKKELDSEPVHNEKYLKAEIISYNGKLNRIFYNDKIPKEGSQFIFLSVIVINCIFSTGNYSSKLFSKQLNLLLKKKRYLSILLTALKFALMILIKKILVKKILMKKTKYRT